MSYNDESWDPLASTLGFENEKHMLKSLYEDEHMTIQNISKLVGRSIWAVYKKLNYAGVNFRSRGGAANRLGHRKLASLTDHELFHISPTIISQKHNVHQSTIFAERRYREAQKGKDLK